MFEHRLEYPVFDADNHLFDSVTLWRGYADHKHAELFEDDVWLSDRERFLSSAIGRRAARFGQDDESSGEESGVFRPASTGSIPTRTPSLPKSARASSRNSRHWRLGSRTAIAGSKSWTSRASRGRSCSPRRMRS